MMARHGIVLAAMLPGLWRAMYLRQFAEPARLPTILHGILSTCLGAPSRIPAWS